MSMDFSLRKVLKAVSLWVAEWLHRPPWLCTLRSLMVPRHVSTGTRARSSSTKTCVSSTEDQRKGFGWLAFRAMPLSHDTGWGSPTGKGASVAPEAFVAMRRVQPAGRGWFRHM
jgi:hypothetical protein